MANFAGEVIMGGIQRLSSLKIPFESFTLYCLLQIYQTGYYIEREDDDCYSSKSDIKVIEKMTKIAAMIPSSCLESLDIESEFRCKKSRKRMKDTFEKIYYNTAP